MTPRFVAAAPKGVQVYPSTHEFIAEQPNRQSRGFGIPGDLAGWDLADGFRLTEPVDCASHSEWRISVHGRDVYAVLRKEPNADRYTFDGPVWLIDQVPDIIDASSHSETLDVLVWELRRHKGQPDSLLDAVRMFHTTFAVLRQINTFDVYLQVVQELSSLPRSDF